MSPLGASPTLSLGPLPPAPISGAPGPSCKGKPGSRWLQQSAHLGCGDLNSMSRVLTPLTLVGRPPCRERGGSHLLRASCPLGNEDQHSQEQLRADHRLEGHRDHGMWPRVTLGAFGEEASLPSGQQWPDQRKIGVGNQLLHTLTPSDTPLCQLGLGPPCSPQRVPSHHLVCH